MSMSHESFFFWNYKLVDFCVLTLMIHMTRAIIYCALCVQKIQMVHFGVSWDVYFGNNVVFIIQRNHERSSITL